MSKTSAEEQLFLCLIQYALWGTPLKSPTNCVHWDAMLEIFKRQAVHGLCSEAAIANKDLLQISKNDQRLLLQQAGGVLKANLLQNNDLISLFNALQSNGFKPILLKGQGVASKYPNPLNRASGDVDIYIGNENFLSARECLIRFVNNEDAFLQSYELPREFNINYGQTCVELHRLALEWVDHSVADYGERLVDKWLGEKAVREYVTINGTQIPVPPIQFNVIYVFLHLWHHYVTWGIGLRQICDWSVLLNYAYKNQLLNLTELKNDLEQLKIMCPWQLMGALAVQKLGLAKDALPFYNAKCETKVECLWNMIKDEGNFGKYGVRKDTPTYNGSYSISLLFHKTVAICKRSFRMARLTPRYAALAFVDFCYTTIMKLVGRYHRKKAGQAL